MSWSKPVVCEVCIGLEINDIFRPRSEIDLTGCLGSVRGGKMRIVVLGSAAGGGFPQWNCRCDVCDSTGPVTTGCQANAVEHRRQPRRQKLDIIQLLAPIFASRLRPTRCFWPTGGADTPIAAVVLTNGDVDQLAG